MENDMVVEGSGKIKILMWLFAHERIHTAELRARRGIQQEDKCQFNCERTESAMHLMRDCVNAKERWKVLES